MVNTSEGYPLAPRAKNIQESPIRQLLSHKVEFSFGGGYPARETFDEEILAQLYHDTINMNPTLLNYNKTPPLDIFVEAVVKIASGRHIEGFKNENVMVSTGSQQELSLLGSAFISPDIPIAVCAPTYLGAMQAFNPYEPTYLQLAKTRENPGDIDIQQLSNLLENYGPNLIYLNPTFGNPDGSTMSTQNRKSLVAEIRRYNRNGIRTVVIEDEPYYEFGYDSSPPMPIYTLMPEATLHLGTFSKIIAPDMRLGFTIGPSEVIEKLITLKGGADLYTSGIDQTVGAQYVLSDRFSGHLIDAKAIYRERRDAMNRAIHEFLPWVDHKPTSGGLFEFLTGLGVDTNILLDRACKEASVSFVPGLPFYAIKDGAPHDSMRLNFSNMPPEKIREGMMRLSLLINEERSR